MDNESGRGRGWRGGWSANGLPDTDDAVDWFTGRLPQAWFSAFELIIDREEITLIGVLADVSAQGPEAEGVVARFRSETKQERIQVAREAEGRYGRKVSWGVTVGDERYLFTHVAAPVMTRLRQPERQVLDTLVDAGVARSRSDALGWCVRLTGEHAEQWLEQLRTAMQEVDKLRGQGPSV